MSNPLCEPCAFCRVGSCGVHHVFRVVPHTHPGAADADMLEVGCCDQFEDAVRAGFIRRKPDRPGLLFLQSTRFVVRFCPFCCAVVGAARVRP